MGSVQWDFCQEMYEMRESPFQYFHQSQYINDVWKSITIIHVGYLYKVLSSVIIKNWGQSLKSLIRPTWFMSTKVKLIVSISSDRSISVDESPEATKMQLYANALLPTVSHWLTIIGGFRSSDTSNTKLLLLLLHHLSKSFSSTYLRYHYRTRWTLTVAITAIVS